MHRHTQTVTPAVTQPFAYMLNSILRTILICAAADRNSNMQSDCTELTLFSFFLLYIFELATVEVCTWARNFYWNEWKIKCKQICWECGVLSCWITNWHRFHSALYSLHHPICDLFGFRINIHISTISASTIWNCWCNSMPRSNNCLFVNMMMVFSWFENRSVTDLHFVK